MILNAVTRVAICVLSIKIFQGVLIAKKDSLCRELPVLNFVIQGTIKILIRNPVKSVTGSALDVMEEEKINVLSVVII